MTETYPSTKLHIGGKWADAVGGETIDVINPLNSLNSNIKNHK